MKIGKKFYLFSFVLVVAALIGIGGTKAMETFRASGDDYQLAITEGETEGILPVALEISAPKNETITLEYDGISDIGEEDVLEYLTGEYDADSLSITSSPKKNKVTIKTKDSSQPLSFQFYLNKVKNEDKEGYIKLLVDGVEKSSVTFNCVDLNRIQTEKVKELAGSAAVEASEEENEEEAETEAQEAEEEAEVPLLRGPVITPFGVGDTVTASTWAELVTHLNTPSVGNINVTAPLTATSDAAVTVAAASRYVTINGQNNAINFAGFSITLPSSAASGSHLELMNMTYSGTGTGSIVSSTGASNWLVTFNGVSGATKALANVPGATVALTGNISLGNVSSNAIVAGSVTANSAAVTFSAISGHLVYSAGALSVTSTDSSFSGSSLTGYLAANTGGNLNFTFTNSSSTKQPISITNSAAGILSSDGVVAASITGADIKVGSHTGFGFAMTGAGSTLRMTSTKLEAASTIQESFINVTGAGSTVHFTDSELKHTHVHNDPSNGTFISFLNAGTSTLNLENTSLTATSTGAFADVTNSTANTGGGSVIRSEESPDLEFEISGPRSIVEIDSGIAVTGNLGGVISIHGLRSEFRVSNEAVLKINATQPGYAAPALVMESIGGGFNVSGKSKIDMTSVGNAAGGSSTLRFYNAGNMTFDISGGSEIKIDKSGTNTGATLDGGKYSAPAIRMFGGDNKVFVKDDSDFIVNNSGAAGVIASDGDHALYGGNQGILYAHTAGGTVGGTNTGNRFEVTGNRANVQIEAAYGPAIQASSGVLGTSGNKGSLDFTVGSGAFFIARGITATADAGSIQADTLTVEIDNPTYYDFVNRRAGGGRVFANTEANSTFQSTRSDVSFWQRGADVTGNPTYSSMMTDSGYAAVYVDYYLSGTNYATIGSSSNAGVSAYLNGAGGMPNMARISANNQKPVVDELRTPTDADSYIWGHVGVPEGKYDPIRDGFTGEIFVELEVYASASATTPLFETTGVVVEDGSTGQVSIYGETARAGMFKAPIPDSVAEAYRGEFMKKGWVVKVKGAWRGLSDKSHANNHHSAASDITAPDRTTIDVTPPETPVITSPTVITNATNTISGTSNEDGAKVFIKRNGTWMTTSGGGLVTDTVSGGTWTLNLGTTLSAGETIEVYLKDHTDLGSFSEFALPTDATTNSYTTDPDGTIGNLNVARSVYDKGGGVYHDAIDYSAGSGTGDDLRLYPASSELGASDIIPTAEVTKTYTTSGDPVDMRVGDVLTYTVVVKNTSDTGSGKNWKDIVLTDPVSSYTGFIAGTDEVTLDGTVLDYSAGDYTYNSGTSTITIPLGDLAPQETYTITFKVKINSTAVGQVISNTATADGEAENGTPVSASGSCSTTGTISQNEDAVVVEFYDDAATPNELHSPVTLTGKVIGSTVDLTAETAVTNAITTVTNNRYVVKTRPTPETAIVVLEGGTTVRYIFSGTLSIHEHPDEIDFGIRNTLTATRVDDPTYSAPFSVWDNRTEGRGWSLTAELETTLAHVTSGAVIPDAIRYRKTADDPTSEITLTGSAQEIERGNNGASNIFTVSSAWKPDADSGTGFRLEVPLAGVSELGEYKATIKWVLSDAP